MAGTNVAPLPVTTITYAVDGSTPLAPAGLVSVPIPQGTNAAGALTLPIPALQLNLNGATGFGSAFGVTDMTQDGFSAGVLSSIAVEPDGTVTARYSNGESKPAGQVELATFRNPATQDLDLFRLLRFLMSMWSFSRGKPSILQ